MFPGAGFRLPVNKSGLTDFEPETRRGMRGLGPGDRPVRNMRGGAVSVWTLYRG